MRKRRGFQAFMEHRWQTLERKAYRRLQKASGPEAGDQEIVCRITGASSDSFAERLEGAIGRLGSMDVRQGSFELSLASGKVARVPAHRVERLPSGSQELRSPMDLCGDLSTQLADGKYADLPDPEGQARRELLHALRRIRAEWTLPFSTVPSESEAMLAYPGLYPGRTFGHRERRIAGMADHGSVRVRRGRRHEDDPAPKSVATKSRPYGRVDSWPTRGDQGSANMQAEIQAARASRADKGQPSRTILLTPRLSSFKHNLE